MSQKLFASDEEIKYASSILIDGEEFDKEKIDIIKCNESIDIKACPGSGKTTALLAKLIILSNQMPFDDNKGICVLTHTNVAINEIKEKLGIKAELLFRYPNHFGTIQSFVDKFLAIPYSSNLTTGRIKQISDEIYNKSYERSFKYNIYRLKKNDFSNKIWSIIKSNSQDGDDWKFLFNLRLGLKDGKFEIFKNKTDQFEIKKPRKRNQKDYTDWTSEEKLEIKSWFIETITNVYEYYNVLSYQDAYLFAKKYITIMPSLVKAFSNRFKYVFLDEMQDTDKYQLEIIDDIFDKNSCIIQRFGDPLQSIYNNKVKSEEIWIPQDPLLISSSKRFGTNIGIILKTVCIEDNKSLIANNSVESLKPIIIVFDNPEDVLPKYCEIVNTKKINDKTIKELSNLENKRIKAFGWVGEKNEDSRPDSQLTIQSYFRNFKKNLKRLDKVDYNSLESFLKKQSTSQLKIHFDNILNALLHVLSIGNVKIQIGNIKRTYNKTLLLDKLDSDHPIVLRKLRIKIAIWAKQIQSQTTKSTLVLNEVKEFIKSDFIPIFKIDSENRFLNEFLNNKPVEQLSDEELKSNNIYKGANDTNIELGTIHSIKGETHCASLYLETSYYGQHESEWIMEQLKGKPIGSNVGVRIKETLKMAYVGMSRPKYLLCLAIHKDRFDSELDMKNGGNWEIINLTQS